MMKEARAYLNVGPGMFVGYRAGKDALDQGPRLVLRGDDDLDMLDQAWAVGNKMAADANGANWPWDTRSMSVGDVVVFKNGAAYACEMIGWQKVDAEAVQHSIADGERHPALGGR